MAKVLTSKVKAPAVKDAKTVKSEKSEKSEKSVKGAAPAKATNKPAANPATQPAAKPQAREEATEAAAQSLTPGDVAPAFTLPNEKGDPVRLADFAGKKVVLYFYPKDDTPGCTRQACGFRDTLSELAAAGVSVVGVSRDGAASHTRFRSKYDLRFPLLSDPDGAVHRAYGAWGTKSNYGKTTTGALRTTVLVGEDGRVRHVWPRVKVDGHAEAVLAAAR
jgi:thioredoxin-dependent peroxiredoxin